MSFEAVPCMFRSTATDGNSSSYIGLLIRPSSSSSNNQIVNASFNGSSAPTNIGAIKSAATVAAATATVIPASAQNNSIPKLIVPSGVQVRLHTAPLPPPPPPTQPPPPSNANLCNDVWVQTPRSHISNSFDSPSPSQVVPQMNGNEYECNVPCTNPSFFPPISSLAPGLSSGRSDMEIMQEMSPVEFRQVGTPRKVVESMNDFSHKNTPEHRYRMSGAHVSNQQQVDYTSGRMISSRYHNGYSGTSDCSATPDSGIHSIAGSPPSSGPFTPSIPSPPLFNNVGTGEVSDGNDRRSTSIDDFSDMPRLIPFHQMKAEDCAVDDEAPHVLTHPPQIDSRPPTSCDGDDSKELPKISITPSLDVNKFVEQIISQMDPKQRKQFAKVIQTKVSETSPSTPDADSFSSNAQSDSCNTENALTPSELPVLHDVTERDIVDSLPGSVNNTSYLEDSFSDPAEEIPCASTSFAFNCFGRMPASNDTCKTVPTVGSSFSDEHIPQDVHDEHESCRSLVNQGSVVNGISEEERVVNGIANELRKESSRWLDGRNEVESILPTLNAEDFREATSGKVSETDNHQQLSSCFNISSTVVAEKSVCIEEKLIEADAEKEEESVVEKYSEEDAKERLCEYRLSVRRRLNEHLMQIIEKVEKQLSDVKLSLGPKMHWTLPWHSVDWDRVSQRVAKQADEKKLLNEGGSKRMDKKKCTRRKRQRKNVLLRNRADCGESSSMSTTENTPLYHRHSLSRKEYCATNEGKYTEIKSNIMIDSYPRQEGMQCQCKSGSCSETDGCLNRLMQIECTSSCRLDGRCTNKRIMHREGVKHLEVFHTTNGCGAGVRTMDDIAKGKFVCEYRGEVVSAETFRHRRETRYRHRKNHYALGLCSGYLIDAYDKGNIARFINHSCDPNCQIQRWTVNGQYRVGIFALRSIRRGEELTYDYNWNASDFDGITPCKCRSKNCRLFLNKNVLMSNREMDIARESRILLVRNVQRSIRRRFSHLKVERRSDSCSPSSRNAIAEPSRTSDPSSTARAFVNDIISEFCSADVLSKKQLMRFKNELSDRLSLSVASHSSSSQNAHRSFLTFLDLAEIDISNALKKLGPRIDRKRVNDLRLACSAIRKKYIHRLRRPAKNSSVACERRGSKGKRDSKVLSVRTDLAYLDSEILVGSYDPDEDSMRISTDCDSDCVRCICGIQEDDGQMIQCDRCHFWLHADCLFEKRKKAKELSEYVCQLCKSAANRTEPVDILLRPEPDYRLPGCTYYRTLVNSRQLQVRINETVYVQKLLDDTHKAILKRISSNSDKSSGEKPVFNIPAEVDVKEFHRKDLRCFRVERLFVGPEGHRFVFGCYYARPHEVYCEPGRLFYKNELFWTPLFDTLPLDAVVGRCLVLEPSVWSTGRPKRPKYKEADVFICEYQVGKNQRYFEKIPAKNRYYINTEPYNFDKFSEALPLERTFTPFVMVKPESQKTEENVHRRCHQKKISTLNEIINRLKKRSNFFTSATKDGTNDREPECKRPRR